MYKFLTFFLAYKESHQYLSISKHEEKNNCFTNKTLYSSSLFPKNHQCKKKCSPVTCFLSGKNMLNASAVLYDHLRSVSVLADQPVPTTEPVNCCFYFPYHLFVSIALCVPKESGVCH